MSWKSIEDTTNDLIDKRIEAERQILWEYYKQAKHMCNEDARGAVISHFSHTPNKAYEVIKEATKHWNNLEHER